MKRKTAKEVLAESFQALAAGKDITDNCGYSPATFYRQFKDKYDLIAWNYARQTAAITEPVDVLFIGGALYAYGIDSRLKEYLQTLKAGDAKKAVVFSREEEPDEEAKRQMSMIVNDIFIERMNKHHL